jgi:hypothetical protein
MTKDEIKDIRENLRGILDSLDDLDRAAEWDSQEAKDLLSDFSHYTERQKAYYRQYRGLMRD